MATTRIEYTIPGMARRVKALLRKYGYTYRPSIKSPYSDTLYFDTWDNKGHKYTEFRISDHATPKDGHKGYQFIVKDIDDCEELLADIEWEISD